MLKCHSVRTGLVTTLKRQATELLSDIERDKEPILITQHGLQRHPCADELVMAIEGNTTLVLLVKGKQHRVALHPGELVVVPQGHWHRFETSAQLKVTGVTPQPTEHSLETPGIQRMIPTTLTFTIATACTLRWGIVPPLEFETQSSTAAVPTFTPELSRHPASRAAVH